MKSTIEHAPSLESFSRTDSGAGLIIKPQEPEQAEEAVKDDFQLAAADIRVEIEDDAASDDVILQIDKEVILGTGHRQQKLGNVVGVKGRGLKL